MGFCKDCEHWEAQSNYAGWAKCRLGSSSGGERDIENSLAYAEDSEFYCAQLKTRETFGCVMFKEKSSWRKRSGDTGNA